MRLWGRIAIIIAAAGFLNACAVLQSEEKDPVLQGERISVLDLQNELEPDDQALSVQGFIAPAPWKNEFWPQAGGYPNHAMQNLFLNEGPLAKVWSADIGSGTRTGLPLTAQPIIVNGIIYTLDTDSKLQAFDVKNGERLWVTDVSDPQEDDAVIGGGPAYSQGVIYVTNGYGEVLALSPERGNILWRAPIPAPARAAPSVMDDRIFVSTLDNRLITMDRTDGRILWDFSGISEGAGLVGAASPAVNREIVVPAFSSGELFALRVENGSVAWAENLSSLRRTGGLTSITDIRGLPVIDKDIVIAISFGGRMAAIDARSGTRVWTREIGGSETPWVAGNHVFVLTSNQDLVALGRDTGAIRWVTKLADEENDRASGASWTGPVLAGGRLIVASTKGAVLEIDPEDGALIRAWNAGEGVRIPPVVAGGMLYLLSEDGTLAAYR